MSNVRAGGSKTNMLVTAVRVSAPQLQSFEVQDPSPDCIALLLCASYKCSSHLSMLFH